MTGISPPFAAGAFAGALIAFVGALAAWPFEELAARGGPPAAPFDGVVFLGVLLATLVPTAVAALVLALTLGHNLPFFPIGSAGWEKAVVLVVAAELAAGVTFGVVRMLIGASTIVASAP